MIDLIIWYYANEWNGKCLNKNTQTKGMKSIFSMGYKLSLNSGIKKKQQHWCDGYGF